MRVLRTLLIVAALIASAKHVWSQRDPSYDFSVVSQVRIDLRELGYPPLDVIPPDESAIRALAVAPDGRLYGATSGERSHLFLLDPQHGYVEPLGTIADAKVVHHALVVGQQGEVFIGTALTVDNNAQGYEHYSGGHLLKYVPTEDTARNGIQIERACPVVDLTVPSKGQGIYALTIDKSRGTIYGLTYPEGEFFSYQIRAGVVKHHGRVASNIIPGEKFENEKAIGRALALDQDGNVYTSGEGGRFYRFDIKTQQLERLEIGVPAVPGREVYNRVDAWTADEEGNLYGGSSDGYLFRLVPAKRAVVNLGKPLNQYRIRGLVLAHNGKLYGIGGDDDEMARLFSYDPVSGLYELLGMIDVNRRPYYSWQGYVFDAMALGLDGTVYMGQAERKSKLYLYYPQ
jgi:outer membrane protein assembly factor BamB